MLPFRCLRLGLSGGHPLSATFDAIDVSFDAIEDPLERREFMEMPTTFFLPAESIDRLRELGGRLLRNSRPYEILLQRIAEIAKRDTPSSEKLIAH